MAKHITITGPITRAPKDRVMFELTDAQRAVLNRLTDIGGEVLVVEPAPHRAGCYMPPTKTLAEYLVETKQRIVPIEEPGTRGQIDAEQNPVARPVNDLGSEELLAALLDTWIDACSLDSVTGEFDTCAISSYTDAAYILARYGEIVITNDMGGRGVKAKLVPRG